MIVAAGALRGQPHEGEAVRFHPVCDLFDAEFVRVASGFVRLLGQAVEAGGDHHIPCGCGEQIPCSLPGDKLIPWQILIESTDDPVAVGPGGTVRVLVAAVGVPVAGRVQPITGHALTVGGGSEQTIGYFFKSVRGFIRQKGILFFQAGGQPRQVEGDTAQPDFTAGFGGKFQAFLVQADSEKGVDGTGNAGFVRRIRRQHRHSGWFGGLEGPMFRIGRAARDPAAQQFNLAGFEWFFRLRRRHDFLRIVLEQALVEFATIGIAGFDRVSGDGRIPVIQPKLGFARFFVHPMAGETMICENWPDFPDVIRDRHRLVT